MAAKKRKPRPNKLASEIFEFCETHLRIGEGGHRLGERMELLPFQKDFIAQAFGNPRPSRAILSTGRKNGKTCISAALVLAGLLGPLRRPGGQIVSASMSREQASIVFRYAVKMLRVSGLDHLVTIRESAKEITHGPTGTTYRAISAESTTAHGMAPYLVIFDELGQVKSERLELFDALSTAGGAYPDFLMLIISTQAGSDAGLLSVLIDDALSGTDPRTVVSLHAADKDADVSDPTAWAAANPALGVFRSLRDVETQAAEAARLPSRAAAFSQYILNCRTSSEEVYLTRETWALNQAEPSREAFEAGPIYCGLDLGSRQDLSSLAMVAQGPDGKIHVRVESWTPKATLIERARRDRAPYDLWAGPSLEADKAGNAAGWLRTTPGVSTAWDHLAFQVVEVLAGLPVEAVFFDRWRIAELRSELDKLGAELPLIEHGQGYRSMGPVIDRLTHEALGGNLACGGNPLLGWAISNSILELDPTGAGKISKRRSFGRVDPAVALAMALRGFLEVEPLGLIESEGLIFI